MVSPDGPAPQRDPPPLLEAEGVEVEHVLRRGPLRRPAGVIRAVAGVSLTLAPGETLGLVGESGSGKSSLGRALLHLETPTAGEVRFRGRPLAALDAGALRRARRELQMVFQDPAAALNPRHTVARAVREPLDVHGLGAPSGRPERVRALLQRVGLEPEYLGRYPHELSGGQRQRVGIARALATDPALVVADEPISALDVSIQAQIVNLLADLRESLGLTYLFIAHDLAMVRHLSDRVAVMLLGKLVETGPREALFRTPLHPYTRALLAAAPRRPVPDRARSGVLVAAPTGDLPDPADPPSGCRYRTRCPFATERCGLEAPELRAPAGTAAGHRVACHHAEEIG
ncbi:MAG: ATP-binding cassette domain-containing protein [Longimicrobiales bacterium]|nr:ATP-binding cassette domain-containing protein [Longimicrobiales bacterium]